MFNPAQDWPVYIVIVIFLGALTYLVIAGRRSDKKENQNKNFTKQ